MKMAATRTPSDLPAHTDQRLSRIVRVLGDNAMLVVSGTKIAEEIGISRSEVWRLVQQLRSSGVQIAGHPATGYRLEAVPDLLLPDALDPLLQGTIFHGQIRHYFRAHSTNALAMQAGQAGEPEGTVFFAEEQTAGRGRGGHDWHSARSTGVYVSILLRPQMAPADVLPLSLLAGVATAAAVQETTRLKPDLRWPNDLLVSRTAYTAEGGCVSEERKFCGILTELNAEVTRVRFVVVGIGINVNQQEFPPDLAGIATSLRLETGREWSRVELAVALLQSFDREYRRFAEPEGRKALLRRFEEGSSYVRGRRVHVEEEGGYSGITEGLDARGFLQLRTEDGKLRTVLSGTVRGI
jgi:BirA family biotin operon repressor/biotin-[acetyl-CoA-carboxylase] ligase